MRKRLHPVVNISLLLFLLERVSDQKALNPKMLRANIFVKLVQWILVKKSKNWLYSHKTNTCNSGFVLPGIIVIYFINEFESPIWPFFDPWSSLFKVTCKFLYTCITDYIYLVFEENIP